MHWGADCHGTGGGPLLALHGVSYRYLDRFPALDDVSVKQVLDLVTGQKGVVVDGKRESIFLRGSTVQGG